MKTVVRNLVLLFSASAALSARAEDSCILNQLTNPTITVQNVLGTYRRLPVENSYHVGTISFQAGSNTNLVWKNTAGVSWSLTPDLANNKLATGSDNPYKSNPATVDFSLQYQAAGRYMGFQFGGELYSLDGAYADVYDPVTGQISIPTVTVGNARYCNVVVNLDKLVSVGEAPPKGVGDVYDPVSGLLTIPSGKVGSDLYNNVVVTPGKVIAAELLPVYSPKSSLHGYASLQVVDSPSEFRYGFSTYTSIQKISDYQIKDLQFGWGTWLAPDNRASALLCPPGTVMRDIFANQGTFWNQFQTIEGGPGQWRSTHFPSNVSKFRLNSTPDCYNNEVASPGYDFLGNASKANVLGMAQLSNQLLIAPDGLTFNLNDRPSALFGYGYLALPLIPANGLTGTQAVGNQSWTLFVNSGNFKGPVSFYVPKSFTAIDALDATLAGKTLDSMPAINAGLALEINGVPAYTVTDASGVTYRRIAKMNFPVAETPTQATLTQDFKHYSKQAVWNSFTASLQAGALPSRFDVSGSYNTRLNPLGLNVWMDDTHDAVQIGDWMTSTATTNQGNGTVFSLSWSNPSNAGALPEYFRKDASGWTPVQPSQVPASTNLAKQNFPALKASAWPKLDTSSGSPWASSRWSAGPFTTKLNDGSTVTYVWYKFVEQPAITRLGLDAVTLQNLQSLVERMHAQYGLNGPTIAEPSSGNLVGLDPALLVTPPLNLSVGYVPIAIGQQ